MFPTRYKHKKEARGSIINFRMDIFRDSDPKTAHVLEVDKKTIGINKAYSNWDLGPIRSVRIGSSTVKY